MCDVRAWLPEIKNNHPKPTDTSSQQQASRNGLSQHLIPCLASHRNTPLDPLSRGEIPPLTPFITNKKSAFQNSPLERGGGCVTPKHCFLKSKQPPEAKKHHISKQQQNHLCPCRALHRNTPLNPLSRGEVLHAINRLLLMRKQYLESPLFERGRGCVTPAHCLLNPKQPPEA